MSEINERPVCHRAEDLVTYLYGEASEVEAKDFSGHLAQCESCRAEFGVFRQVHESIQVWRSEALGSRLSPAPATIENAAAPAEFVLQRKLTALAALREFFSVSPLWLRAAAGFAALLLCVLGVLTISHSWNRPVQVLVSGPVKIADPDREPRYSQQDVDKEVKKRVEEMARHNDQQSSPKANETSASKKPTVDGNRNQLAANLVQPKPPRPRGLSRQERVQLAADLRLIPREEDELPFVLADEPNQ